MKEAAIALWLMAKLLWFRFLVRQYHKLEEQAAYYEGRVSQAEGKLQRHLNMKFGADDGTDGAGV